MCFAQLVDSDAEDHGITDRLDQPNWQLDRSTVKEGVACTDAIGDVLAKLYADRLDAPFDRIDEHGLDRADGLAIGADHGPALKILG
jgi:hypothetical protein